MSPLPSWLRAPPAALEALLRSIPRSAPARTSSCAESAASSSSTADRSGTGSCTIQAAQAVTGKRAWPRTGVRSSSRACSADARAADADAFASRSACACKWRLQQQSGEARCALLASSCAESAAILARSASSSSAAFSCAARNSCECEEVSNDSVNSTALQWVPEHLAPALPRGPLLSRLPPAAS